MTLKFKVMGVINPRGAWTRMRTALALVCIIALLMASSIVQLVADYFESKQFDIAQSPKQAEPRVAKPVPVMVTYEPINNGSNMAYAVNPRDGVQVSDQATRFAYFPLYAILATLLHAFSNLLDISHMDDLLLYMLTAYILASKNGRVKAATMR